MKIIISVALAVFLLGCSDDSSTSAKKDEILKKVNAPQEIKAVVVEETPEVGVIEKEDTKTAIVVAQETTVEVVEEASEKKVEAPAVEVKASKSAAELYKVCSSCHGVSGEKKALNKSQVIQAWDSGRVETALKGYKDGSYGGAMKGLMKSQAANLSDEDIAALAKYISEL